MNENVTQSMEFEDIIRTTKAAFLREHWGRRALLTSLASEGLDSLIDGFCEGDVVRLLEPCRKSCNSSFSAEEQETMARDLDSHSRTINMPYCFCQGALDLYDAAVSTFGDLSNDIEVGVYISKAGGDVAEWHCDANHNFTIQLTGTKEWHVLPAGDNCMNSSRGMFDAPRNRAEQGQVLPSMRSATVYSMQPGSVLYLPPGEWHRVRALALAARCPHVE